MSLLPYLVSELLEEMNSPTPTLYDQNFGLGVHPDGDFCPQRFMRVPLNSGYVRPWRIVATSNSGLSNVQDSKTDFKVSLDVQQFRPEEINVKLQDNFVVVEAKHDERQDKHGFIARHFTRRYRLPDNVDQEKIKSSLSSDGVLSLTAPKKFEPHGGERTIQIERTNQPALKQQQQQQGTQSGDGEGQQSQEKMEN